jgi:ferritin-like metal-binding protein YciE
MSNLKSLEELLIQEIKDLFSAEEQLVKALPKMAKAASDPALKDAFLTHLDETKVHLDRLERVAQILDDSPNGKICKAMSGLVEEGEDAILENDDIMLKDLALIIAAQKAEHYEISAYGSAKSLAAALDLEDVVDLLQVTEDEESEADSALTSIADDIMDSFLMEV